MRLARCGLAPSGLWLTTFVHPAWTLLTIGAFLATMVSGAATYYLSKTLAQNQQLLDGWQDAFVRTTARKNADSVEELNIYRIRASDVIDELRRRARGNRRMHNSLQVVIIVGSIAVTSLTSIGLNESAVRWATVGVAAAVSMAAGISGFFKYRERSQNQQRTADAIEKELHHLQLGVGVYGGKRPDALKLFAVTVEALRDEQRRAELQLDQTSVSETNRGASPQT